MPKPALKVAVLVSGVGTNLQAIIDAIFNGKIANTHISLVVSTNPKAYALERAKNFRIESLVLKKADFASNTDREDALHEELSKRDIDLVVFSGCLMILSADFIEKWGKPIINVHPSLLPAYGGHGFHGIAVHEAVLAAGETQTGATVHYIDGGIDTGDIILQKAVAVHPNDTPETLQKRVMEEAEWIILPQAISIFAQKKANSNCHPELDSGSACCSNAPANTLCPHCNIEKSNSGSCRHCCL